MKKQGRVRELDKAMGGKVTAPSWAARWSAAKGGGRSELSAFIP